MSKPRKCSSRWLDGDCPKGVLAIFDDARTIDRYMVIYAEPIVDDVLSYVAMNAAPFHPQGFGQHGEFHAYQAKTYRYANKQIYTLRTCSKFCGIGPPYYTRSGMRENSGWGGKCSASFVGLLRRLPIIGTFYRGLQAGFGQSEAGS